ncbi:WD40-repeat-containing domain protein [Catenaria anguillulae PL171]|uniref:WD40-repeat-containing domain protein n=1 Tax=Catenaria anguillulae PL171 TaxID=765915 RepID=A0A1Y2I3N1_9FUNG|nr:WD40-repeat-containing domain protein [Catenaria anguillulae PL171]
MSTSINTSSTNVPVPVPVHSHVQGSPVAIANSLILAYLRDRDAAFASTRSAFLHDLEQANDPVYLGDSAKLPPLVALVEHWLLSAQSSDTADAVSHELASLALEDDDINAGINHPPTDPAHQLCLGSPADLDNQLEETPHLSFPLIHAANILTSQALVVPAIDPTLAPLLVTSAADKSIQFTHTRGDDSPLPIASVTNLPAPALVVAQHPSDRNLLVAGCMDGSLILIRATDPNSIAITHTSPTHTPRPCVTVAWTPDGLSLVSGGYNRQLTVSTYDQSTLLLAPCPRLHYHFANPIESLVVCPLNPAYALVATRDSNVLYLCLLTHASSPPTEINTHDRNSVPGHVSFSVMHLANSPSGKYVLGTTSAASGRILLWQWTLDAHKVPGLRLVRNYYAGGAQDEWSKPRVAWVGTADKYFAVTSDTHAIVVFATWPRVEAVAAHNKDQVCVVGRTSANHMYTTTSAQVVARLRGHKHVVKDVTYSDELKAIVSGGFDQCVKVWQVFCQ